MLFKGTGRTGMEISEMISMKIYNISETYRRWTVKFIQVMTIIQ